MTFLLLLAAIAIAYFAWRIVDQLPDIVYRLSEIQRDLADLRRHLVDSAPTAAGDAAADAEAATDESA